MLVVDGHDGKHTRPHQHREHRRTSIYIVVCDAGGLDKIAVGEYLEPITPPEHTSPLPVEKNVIPLLNAIERHDPEGLTGHEFPVRELHTHAFVAMEDHIQITIKVHRYTFDVSNHEMPLPWTRLLPIIH